ncbi:hypothetical protein niasHT_036742 [Heterodera trifolii]|uniref:Uncharacterized protein n=1 Tax=Heterodera trifolii TaxID=157864 RepID=A0ABD2IUW7_9BILA
MNGRQERERGVLGKSSHKGTDGERKTGFEVVHPSARLPFGVDLLKSEAIESTGGKVRDGAKQAKAFEGNVAAGERDNCCQGNTNINTPRGVKRCGDPFGRDFFRGSDALDKKETPSHKLHNKMNGRCEGWTAAAHLHKLSAFPMQMNGQQREKQNVKEGQREKGKGQWEQRETTNTSPGGGRRLAPAGTNGPAKRGRGRREGKRERKRGDGAGKTVPAPRWGDATTNRQRTHKTTTIHPSLPPSDEGHLSRHQILIHSAESEFARGERGMNVFVFCSVLFVAAKTSTYFSPTTHLFKKRIWRAKDGRETQKKERTINGEAKAGSNAGGGFLQSSLEGAQLHPSAAEDGGREKKGERGGDIGAR